MSLPQHHRKKRGKASGRSSLASVSGAVSLNRVHDAFQAGATVDYSQDMIRASFSVTENPNTEVLPACLLVVLQFLPGGLRMWCFIQHKRQIALCLAPCFKHTQLSRLLLRAQCTDCDMKTTAHAAIMRITRSVRVRTTRPQVDWNPTGRQVYTSG